MHIFIYCISFGGGVLKLYMNEKHEARWQREAVV
jgi:hypothetical protein